MKMIERSFVIFLIFLLAACSLINKEASNKNEIFSSAYNSVSQIRAEYEEDIDFFVQYKKNNSPVSVFAIHGGDIEGGTSELARTVAGDDYSYYMFEAYGKNARKFHITASKFDDVPALEIAAASRLGLAMHVQKGNNLSICVGGGNLEAAKMMADMLVSEGYPVEFPCVRLPGKSPKNIVNRTRLGGVQFEFTSPMIRKIIKNKKTLRGFSKKIRQTAENYLNSMPEHTLQHTNELGRFP